MKRTSIFNAVIIGIFLNSFGLFAQDKKWTLEECVSYAMEHNISIKSSDLDLQLSQIDKKDARGAFLPTINAGANHSWNIGLNQNITTGLLENQTTQFTSANLNVGIDIYKGLQNQIQLRRSNLAILASRYAVTKMQEDVSLNVVNAYMQILFNKENLKVQQKQLEYDSKQLERVTQMVEAGNVPQGDLMDIQATVANDNQLIITAENNLLISKISLAQLLQLEDFETFDIEATTMDVSHSAVLMENASEIVKKAMESRTTLKVASSQVELAEKDLQLAKSRYLPTLQGFYSFNTRAAYADQVVGYQINPNNPFSVIGTVEGTNQNVVTQNFSPLLGSPDDLWQQFDNNKGQNFGLSLNVPILNGLSVRHNVERNKVNVLKSKLNLDTEKQNVQRTVYTAFTDTKAALKSHEAALSTLEFRKKSYEYAQERYAVGLITIFDFTQAQTLYANAQSEVLRTKYDYIFKTKILEFYYGIPLVSLNN
ncbi:MAG: TolC family protein [Flavobacterium sp.]|nr:TolC family protein [Candidatus Neoflavobacterium equi]